jgi:hypothetical protein
MYVRNVESIYDYDTCIPNFPSTQGINQECLNTARPHSPRPIAVSDAFDILAVIVSGGQKVKWKSELCAVLGPESQEIERLCVSL